MTPYDVIQQAVYAHPLFAVFWLVAMTGFTALIFFGAWLALWFLYTVPRSLQRIANYYDPESVTVKHRGVNVIFPRPGRRDPSTDSIVAQQFPR